MTEKFYRGRSQFGAQIAYIIFFLSTAMWDTLCIYRMNAMQCLCPAISTWITWVQPSRSSLASCHGQAVAVRRIRRASRVDMEDVTAALHALLAAINLHWSALVCIIDTLFSMPLFDLPLYSIFARYLPIFGVLLRAAGACKSWH